MTGNRWDARAYDTAFSFVTQRGSGVLDLLAARPGEHILDIGCGTGGHAAQLVALGCTVVGVDASASMLAVARAQVPDAAFVDVDVVHDAPTLGEFDAVLSNAALHWMQPQEVALAYVRACLAPGGRFVAEMGGHGNVALMLAAFEAALADCGLVHVDLQENWFPTIPQESMLLEAAGFEVVRMELFDRPTPLEGAITAADWCAHFRATTWHSVPSDRHPALREAINAHAAQHLHGADGWWADYRRLRFVAIAR